MTAEPTSHEPSIGERVDYTRAQPPASQRQPYTQELREATSRRSPRVITARSATWSSGGTGRQG